MKKLVAEYSWPLRDISVNRYSTWPLINEQAILDDFNEFMKEALNYINKEGFNLSVRIV